MSCFRQHSQVPFVAQARRIISTSASVSAMTTRECGLVTYIPVNLRSRSLIAIRVSSVALNTTVKVEVALLTSAWLTFGPFGSRFAITRSRV